MRDRIGYDQDRLFPEIAEQERLKLRTVLESLITLCSLSPTQRKVTVNHADAVVDYFIVLRKIIPAPILDHRTSTAQLGELFNDPRQCVLIGIFVTNRQVHFNANSWSEARQGALSSIQLSSFLTGVETQHLRFFALEVLAQSQ